MDIKIIRKANLQRLIAASDKPKQASLAHALGKKPAQISQWLSGHRTISEESAREIEARLQLAEGWMDRDEGVAKVPRVLGPEPQRLTVVLKSAIVSISEAVKHEMPDDLRDDVADALAKLVRRKGNHRQQQEVLRLLEESSKPGAAAA